MHYICELSIPIRAHLCVHGARWGQVLDRWGPQELCVPGDRALDAFSWLFCGNSCFFIILRWKFMIFHYFPMKIRDLSMFFDEKSLFFIIKKTAWARRSCAPREAALRGPCVWTAGCTRWNGHTYRDRLPYRPKSCLAVAKTFLSITLPHNKGRRHPTAS